MYDQRLFNQTAGLGSGFGNEEVFCPLPIVVLTEDSNLLILVNRAANYPPIRNERSA